jgi:hypothetical protein
MNAPNRFAVASRPYIRCVAAHGFERRCRHNSPDGLRQIEMTASAKCGTLRQGRSFLEFQTMLRALMIAGIAAAAIAVAAAPTDASARGRGGGGGGFHGGGFHGGGFHGGGFRGGYRGYGYRGYGYRGYGYGLGYYPYYYGAYGLYGGCYRSVRVFTPVSPRWRRVWVCG